MLLAAWDAGIRAFGENRLHEAEAKFPQLPAGAARHFIGPLQSNKAKRAAAVADVIESRDSLDVARRLSVGAQARGKDLVVFVEVNLGGEATKAGIVEGEQASFRYALLALHGLERRV